MFEPVGELETLLWGEIQAAEARATRLRRRLHDVVLARMTADGTFDVIAVQTKMEQLRKRIREQGR